MNPGALRLFRLVGMRQLGPWCVIVLAAMLICGCQVPVAASLHERDANVVAAALNRAGIEASKQLDPNTEGRYQVLVARAELATAIGTLRDHDLPPRNSPGLADAVGKGSLVPSPLAEQTQYVAGLAGDLERSLGAIDGVSMARVHLSIPEQKPLFGTPEKRPSASVLLHHFGATSPIGKQDVQALVAGAVTDLAAENVAVVSVSRGVSTPPPRTIRYFGPVGIANDSVAPMRIGAGAVLVVVTALFLTVLVLYRRLNVLKKRLALSTDPSIGSPLHPDVNA